jgi:hypothetical protein
MDRKYRQLQVDVANLQENMRTIYEYHQKLNENMLKLFKLLMVLTSQREIET